MKKKNMAAVVFIVLVMIYLLIPLFVTAVYSAFENGPVCFRSIFK